jgi:hypothetical protein
MGIAQCIVVVAFHIDLPCVGGGDGETCSSGVGPDLWRTMMISLGLVVDWLLARSHPEELFSHYDG